MGRKKKRIKLVCKQCGKEFEVIPARVDTASFCSRKCMGLWNSANGRGENNPNWQGGKIKLICEQCEEEFEAKPCQAGKARFCSQKCWGLWQSENVCGEDHPAWKGGKVRLICRHCGKEFEVIPYKADIARFCSVKCQNLWKSENWCGKKHPSWKEKVKRVCEWCGKDFEMIPSHAYQRFCSQKCWGLWMSESLCGENNWNWQGGISFEPYGLDWTDKLKEEVRKRDDYACAISGEVWQEGQEKFPVHHCDYDKTNNNPDNLITLSKSSHARTNTNRLHWQALLVHVAKGAEMRANAFVGGP